MTTCSCEDEGKQCILGGQDSALKTILRDGLKMQKIGLRLLLDCLRSL